MIEIGPPDGPRQIAAQGFQLDHVGAQIGQQPSARGPGDQIGDLEDTDARQGRWIGLMGRRPIAVGGNRLQRDITAGARRPGA